MNFTPSCLYSRLYPVFNIFFTLVFLKPWNIFISLFFIFTYWLPSHTSHTTQYIEIACALPKKNDNTSNGLLVSFDCHRWDFEKKGIKLAGTMSASLHTTLRLIFWSKQTMLTTTTEKYNHIGRQYGSVNNGLQGHPGLLLKFI